MSDEYDTVVVGGGQSGLAVAYELRRTDRSFVVLDAAARVGDAWRRRWRSLRLFTPAAGDGLPGAPYPAHRAYRPSKDEMADFVEEYAARFALPVRSSTEVSEVRAADGSFDVVAGGTSVRARHVVVATGPYTVPYVPAFAGELTVTQLHAHEYRSPEQVTEGPVVVVGAGNSGAEIAIELAAEHRVHLSGRDTGNLPANLDPSLFQLLPRVRTDRGVGRRLARRLAGKGTPLIDVGRRDLAAAGVTRVPRVTGTSGGLPRLADGRVLDVGTVVWSTGYRDDFGWLPPGACTANGTPVHDGGVARHVPGLGFAGLRFQTTLASGIVAGAARDAGVVVASLLSRAAPRDGR